MPAFFSGRSGEVAQLLDESRHALESDKPASDEIRWADSLVMHPTTRLIDPASGGVAVKLQRLYDSGGALPAGAQLRLQLVDSGGAALNKQVVDVLALPVDAKLVVGASCEGDCKLRGEVIVNGKVLATNECGVSFVPVLNERLSSYKSKQYPKTGTAPTEQLTATSHYRLLKAMAGGRDFETDYPAAKMLGEMLELNRLEDGAVYFDNKRPGQFWLTLSTEKGPAPIRLQVPKGLDKEPKPLVIAMHGAGGSENMFFEAYGHGEIVRQCEKPAGWWRRHGATVS